jgi:hypothetical protein
MIAEPNSSTGSVSSPTSTSFLEGSPLSADELYQLTLYKWRYSLEAYGFEPEQVRALMFMKWLYASHRVQG